MPANIPKFTIVLRTCGRWPLLDRALHGILAQPGDAIAALLVTAPAALMDLTRTWLLGYSSRLPVVPGFLEAEGGDALPKRLADAILRAGGDLVAFLDDDDLWPAHHLTRMRQQALPGSCVIAPAFIREELVTHHWEILKRPDPPQPEGTPGIELADIWQGNYPAMSCWTGDTANIAALLNRVPCGASERLALQMATMGALDSLLNTARVEPVLISRRVQNLHAPYANLARTRFSGLCHDLLAWHSRNQQVPHGKDADMLVKFAVAGVLDRKPRQPVEAAVETPEAFRTIPASPPEPRPLFTRWLFGDKKSDDQAKSNPERPGRSKDKKFQSGFQRVGLVSPSGLNPKEVHAALGAKKRLTLDIFDTTLARRVGRPVDLFLEIGKGLADLPGITSPEQFWALRIAAEREARTRRHAEAGHHEIGLEDIYAVLSEWCGWNPEAASRAMKREIACEDACLYPIPSIARVAAEARQAGKELWFISDMYHGSATLREWLTGRGLEFDGVEVSCEHAANKAGGELYKKLHSARSWQAAEQLHVGDNRQADVIAADKLGITALHFRDLSSRRPLLDQVHVPAHNDTDFAFSLTLGLAREFRRHVEPADMESKEHWLMLQLGYELGGSLSVGFCHWLLDRALQAGLRKLFFLRRDGWLFQQVATEMAAAWGVPVDCSELYGSRRIFERARLDGWSDAEVLELCAHPPPGSTVKDLLSRVGLNWEDAAEAARAAGFTEPDAILVDHHFRPKHPDLFARLHRLFKRLAPMIHERAAEEASLLTRYYQEHGLTSRDSGIVDFGWSGSSAQIFQRLARRLDGPDARLHAYYFGSWNVARKAMTEGCHLESWFFSLEPMVEFRSLKPPRLRHEIVEESIQLLEMLFSSLEPSAVALRGTADSGIVPVFAEPEFGPAEQSLLAAFHQGALRFTRDFLKHMPAAPASTALDVYVEHAMKRLLSLPSPEEARLFSRFVPREEHIAKTPLRTLCRVPERVGGLDRAQQLLDAYHACMWKKAFRVQLDQEEHKLLPQSL